MIFIVFLIQQCRMNSDPSGLNFRANHKITTCTSTHSDGGVTSEF